jgi:acetyl esterase/lipase
LIFVNSRTPFIFALTAAAGLCFGRAAHAENLFIWPDLAPGETARDVGENQPPKAGENPPITRTINIRRPSMDVFLAPEDKSNGTAILVLPGGGFGKVVPDMEGSEAAPWLAEMGISTFVLRYRTSEAAAEGEPLWKRPLQDAQRALRLIRANADKWKIAPDRIGVLAFSAGGQVGAILHARGATADYKAKDEIDKQSSQADFSLLIYPWNVTSAATGKLLPEINYNPETKPAFIVHTHDDRSTSLGSVLIYLDLKANKVPAELHVYENGGHGYGMRSRENSFIGTWPDRAGDWLKLRGLGSK